MKKRNSKKNFTHLEKYIQLCIKKRKNSNILKLLKDKFIILLKNVANVKINNKQFGFIWLFVSKL